MKVLHLCNDFSYSKVHTNLYEALDRLGCVQTIYHPLRKKENQGKNVFDFYSEGSDVVYSDCIKTYHRILFRTKIKFLFNDLKKKIDFSGITVQHATTLFSDGALALKIYKNFGIPYVVTLRNTDINLFLKLRPDLYRLGKEILTNAQSIIFISPALKKLFFEHFYFKTLETVLSNKIVTIPNGIDRYWLENISASKKRRSNNFLFIGRFDANKNVLRLIQAIGKCRSDFPNLTLTLVGGGGKLHDKVLSVIEGKEWIKFVGPIYDKGQLKLVFRENDFFVMPSIYETFGLVYVEALSQGLPILYTKGQGVDGVIEESVGVGTNPMHVEKISDALKDLVHRRQEFVINISNLDFSRFDWNNISNIYMEIFKS